VIDKIKETNEWLDERLEQIEVFKPKNEPQQKQEEKKDQLEGDVLKGYKFKNEKLNEIASQIQVMHIPNTKDMISIKTYTQIVEGSVDLAESEFIRIT
jgi:hypothetical protein